MRYTTQLLPSRSGNLGVMVLNNPKALNALTLDMIRCMADVLGEWHASGSSLKAVLIKGSTETKKPTFSAGGDVKSIYLDCINNDSGPHGLGQRGVVTADFFREEYALNHAMHAAPFPQVAFWDGMVMGGGVGVSIHGKYRVATERATLAMPETNIGFFPDVGSMYWMPRLLKGGLASFCALTGHRMNAFDLLYTGIATHFVPSDKLVELETALVEATEADDAAGDDVVAPVLMSFHNPPSDIGFLEKNRSLIDSAFDRVTRVEEILAKIPDELSFAGETMRKMSPTSMQITLEALERGGKAQSLADCLAMEYRLSQHFMKAQSDFYEGIRSHLVDKDHQPKWSPSSPGEVNQELVHRYFESLPEGNEWEVDSISSKL